MNSSLEEKVQISSFNEEEFIEAIIAELTLKEKSDMIHGGGLFRSNGVKRLNIPPIVTSDGPMGVRKEHMNARWRYNGFWRDYSTYLPSNTALAATWNTELAYAAGHVLGTEARGRGKDMILAPGINIQRAPLCGRNFEYMSEDPKLIEEMVVPFIEGVQTDTDVSACVKHFAANSQETDRMQVNTIISERALREIYFPGFKAALKKAGSKAVMGAYNKLDGEHCSQSKKLLDGVLRDEWGYDGLIVSDWGAVHDTKEAAESALDLEMDVTYDFDNYFLANPLIKAVEEGSTDEKHLDKKVRNILRFMLRTKMIGPQAHIRSAGTYNIPEHRETVLDTAREAVVLLKNEENILPLSKENYRGKRLLVIGQNAARLHSNGGGSSEIKALYEISPLMGICMELGGNTTVKYVKGYHIPKRIEDEDMSYLESLVDTKEEEAAYEAMSEERKKEKESEETSKAKQSLYFDEALALAAVADEVIYVGGLDHFHDVEGWDRKDMKLPYEQDKLIEALLEIRPDMPVIIMAGSPVEMPWIDKAKSLIWYSYAGNEGGRAVSDVLFGNVNPSGRLPFTMPVKLEDSPAMKLGEFGKEGMVKHNEGIYVGYRYFDTYGVEPLFPFGHGLSYTSFEYDEDIEVEVYEEVGIELSDRILADNEPVSPFEAAVTVRLRNTGTVAGSEVIQLYVSDLECSVDRPVHELKAFKKVYLEPGEEAEVELYLTKEAFGFYDEKEKCFKAEAGEFEIQVGASSRDLRAGAVIELMKGYKYSR